MFRIICITHRRLCAEPFEERLKKLAAAGPDAIILREKDLAEEEYLSLAERTADLCGKAGVRLILHGQYHRAAARQGIKNVHFPMEVLRTLTEEEKGLFTCKGASCHAPEDTEEAARLGCRYVTAGHIFDTECKEGIPGRGLGFLAEMCSVSPVPVFAVGGINETNIRRAVLAGADGVCVMSGFMTCPSPERYMTELRKGL